MVAAARMAPINEYVGGPGLSTKDAKLLAALVTSIEEKSGRLNTEELLKEVVARSRPKTSPTHHLFEWDVHKGHALYLMERARQLVMHVKVILIESPEKPVRAFPVVITGGKRGPLAMQRVLDNRDLLAALLEQAKADLEAWQRRYEQLRHIAGLRGVFVAVQKATGKGRKS